MIKYKCHYNLAGMNRSVESERGIGAFRDGFWVNAENELSNASDVKYWIPPSKILYIEKVGEY